MADTDDQKARIAEALSELTQSFPARFENADNEQTLRDENAKIMGKKGALTAILKELGKVAPADRKAIGESSNALRTKVEAAFNARLADIQKKKRDLDLNARPFDLTLPGRVSTPRGHRHPISLVREEIVEIFRGMGFGVFDGPDIDFEENNFGKLGYPPDHPATDMQDTFYTDAGHLLRSHTSNIQARAMSTMKPPFAFIAPGTVFRRDDDMTHSPMFHQLEAFLVDTHVSLAHLRGALSEFAARLFGPGTPVRLRPSYFPFVEPGAEVDLGCPFCKDPNTGERKGCNVCKHTGFIEILGCGMIHPAVFEACGIDPEKYSGFALGMGLERVAIVRYGIPNIKMLFDNDPRFLSQF